MKINIKSTTPPVASRYPANMAIRRYLTFILEAKNAPDHQAINSQSSYPIENREFGESDELVHDQLWIQILNFN